MLFENWVPCLADEIEQKEKKIPIFSQPQLPPGSGEDWWVITIKRTQLLEHQQPNSHFIFPLFQERVKSFDISVHFSEDTHEFLNLTQPKWRATSGGDPSSTMWCISARIYTWNFRVYATTSSTTQVNFRRMYVTYPFCKDVNRSWVVTHNCSRYLGSLYEFIQDRDVKFRSLGITCRSLCSG